MRFLYQKEFVAQRDASPAAAVAELYRRRGLSTDTAVEAGYVVHLGLGRAEGPRAGRRVRRVLIVGPGLDLAPRTGLRRIGAAGELSAVGRPGRAARRSASARRDDLEVVAADINPRVVAHLRRGRASIRRCCAWPAACARAGRCRCRRSTATTSIASAARCRRRPPRRRAIPATASAARRCRVSPRRRRARCAPSRSTSSPSGSTASASTWSSPPTSCRTSTTRSWRSPSATSPRMLAPGGAFLHNEQRPDHRRPRRRRSACRCSSRATRSSPP